MSPFYKPVMPEVSMGTMDPFEIHQHAAAEQYDTAEMRAMEHQNDLNGGNQETGDDGIGGQNADCTPSRYEAWRSPLVWTNRLLTKGLPGRLLQS